MRFRDMLAFSGRDIGWYAFAFSVHPGSAAGKPLDPTWRNAIFGFLEWAQKKPHGPFAGNAVFKNRLSGNFRLDRLPLSDGDKSQQSPTD